MIGQRSGSLVDGNLERQQRTLHFFRGDGIGDRVMAFGHDPIRPIIKPCDSAAQRARGDRRRVVSLHGRAAPPCYGAITGRNRVRFSFSPDSGCFVGDILLVDQKYGPGSPC